MTELDLFDIEEMTIEIASRHLEPTNKAPSIVTVITGKQIKNMGARNVMDILRRVPGFGTHQYWVGYKVLEVRGIKSPESGSILMMINGHRLNNAFFGSWRPLYDDLSVKNIKKIEIIRGPGSALYGENAFLSVINVITKDADDIDGAQITTSVGSFDTHGFNLLFGKRIDDVKVSGSFDYFNTKGSRVTVEEDAATYFDGLFGT